MAQSFLSHLPLLEVGALWSQGYSTGQTLESDSTCCTTDSERKILTLDSSALETRPCWSQTQLFCSSVSLACGSFPCCCSSWVSEPQDRGGWHRRGTASPLLRTADKKEQFWWDMKTLLPQQRLEQRPPEAPSSPLFLGLFASLARNHCRRCYSDQLWAFSSAPGQWGTASVPFSAAAVATWLPWVTGICCVTEPPYLPCSCCCSHPDQPEGAEVGQPWPRQLLFPAKCSE